MGRGSQLRRSEVAARMANEFVRSPGGVCVRVTTAGDWTHNNTGNWLPVVFDTERWDMGVLPTNARDPTGATYSYPNGFWDVAQPTRLTAVWPGRYEIKGHVLWDAVGVGNLVYLAIRLNGVTYIRRERWVGHGTEHDMGVDTQYILGEGDYIELMAWQNSGGNLDILQQGNFSPEFMMGIIPI